MYRHTPETELQRTIRLMYENPQEFDPDMLPVSEIVQPDGLIIAKIPQIPGRISRRKTQGSDGYYIELILSQRYDPQTRQIRTVNEILSELKDLFTGSEAEDFLHLAEEPEGDGTSSGTTYGEMALLLNAYSSMLLHFAVGRLNAKNKK